MQNNGAAIDLKSAERKSKESSIIVCPNKIKWTITKQVSAVELKQVKPTVEE